MCDAVVEAKVVVGCVVDVVSSAADVASSTVVVVTSVVDVVSASVEVTVVVGMLVTLPDAAARASSEMLLRQTFAPHPQQAMISYEITPHRHCSRTLPNASTSTLCTPPETGVSIWRTCQPEVTQAQSCRDRCWPRTS